MTTIAATAAEAPPRLLQRANIAPLALVNLGVGLHAVIWYMASTAMPTAIGEVGGAEYLSWVGSFYLVTTIIGGAVTAMLFVREKERRQDLILYLLVMIPLLLRLLRWK